jgi:Domain of unknown function (DUF6852)/Domain of unknown function (DUF5606)
MADVLLTTILLKNKVCAKPSCRNFYICHLNLKKMKYKEIVAVSGLSGLFQLLSSKSDGGIVRSLDDKTTRFISSRIHQFTPLESIEVFTTGENITLSELFKAMQDKEDSIKIPTDKASDPKALKEYFTKVYPEMDHEKVYVSDMKKMVKWYGILKLNDLLHFEEVIEEDSSNVKEQAETITSTLIPAKTEVPPAKEKKTASSKTKKKEDPSVKKTAPEKETGTRKNKSAK